MKSQENTFQQVRIPQWAPLHYDILYKVDLGIAFTWGIQQDTHLIMNFIYIYREREREKEKEKERERERERETDRFLH